MNRPSEQEIDSFCYAAGERGDIAAVREALDKYGAGIVNAYHSSGVAPPLLYAANWGHKDIAELLLQNGADINLRGEAGETMLMSAAYSTSNPETALFFLGKGVDLNERDNAGQTALTIACAQNMPETAALLLDRGIDVEGRDDRGRTALMFAATSGQKEIMTRLLMRGVDVEAKDELGWTALMYAAAYSSQEAIKLLLEHGAKVTVKNNKGDTACTLAPKYRPEIAPDIVAQLENAQRAQFLKDTDFRRGLEKPIHAPRPIKIIRRGMKL
jgi:ankyrin repeat protein